MAAIHAASAAQVGPAGGPQELVLICKTCHETKTDSEYYATNKSVCKKCCSQRARRYYLARKAADQDCPTPKKCTACMIDKEAAAFYAGFSM